MTYDELGKSNEISIIASLLNIQTAFEDDKLLPGMAWDEQCMFYLELIENEPFFGHEEELFCEEVWPVTGNSLGKDFSDITNSTKMFVIPMPPLSKEITDFGIKIRLDPTEGAWVGFGDNCNYSTVYKKANRDIRAIYHLEDEHGNFQSPNKKQQMNICIRVEHSDPERTFSKLWLRDYGFLPGSDEESMNRKNSQKLKKSHFRRKSMRRIAQTEALLIEENYKEVKDKLSLIEGAIKIDSKYKISDWGSLAENDEQIFGQNRFRRKIATGSIIGGSLGSLIIVIIIIFIVYRCYKRSKNAGNYAAGRSKSRSRSSE